jgi:hypothetical protein
VAGQEAGGLVAIVDPQLAARAVAIGVDRGLRHPQFARDLLGAQVLIDQAQTVALARRQELDPRISRGGGFAHGVKR